jgi:hypothetical protein
MCSRGAGVKEPAARDYILKGPFTDLMVLSPNERLRNYGRPARAIEVAAEHDISGRPRVAVVVVRSRLLEALVRDSSRDKCLTKVSSSDVSANPYKTDDLDVGGRIWRGRIRLRALWAACEGGSPQTLPTERFLGASEST